MCYPERRLPRSTSLRAGSVEGSTRSNFPKAVLKHSVFAEPCGKQKLTNSDRAAAIRIKGGPSIQEECNRIGPIRIGEAAITGGGKLAARHVIRAASMRLGGLTSEQGLRESTRNSLLRAKENGLESISFPRSWHRYRGFSDGSMRGGDARRDSRSLEGDDID